MSKSKTYDHIIAGSGLAGLSLAYKLSKEKGYDQKKLLLIDKERKTKNDRTWCFWEKGENAFEEIVYHHWPRLRFASSSINKELNIAPYNYKMIRGLDFYQFVLESLSNAANITIVQDEITSLEELDDSVTVHSSSGSYEGAIVFKSYPDKLDHTDDQFVWQHFKGWKIKTAEDTFDPQEATLMDFRIEQGKDTIFFYVLPTSTKEALIEVTFFSKTILESEVYDPYLRNYLSNTLGISNYIVEEEELGAIPMTTYDFQQTRTDRVIPIGTNGGSVKASSGYAFRRVQRDITALIPYILKDNLQHYAFPRNRYVLYDKIMLNAILTGKTSGSEVFTRLFKKLSPQTIFKFLDEEGSFLTDLKIFTAPPMLPFFKAFVEEVL